jgi:hypothetical protein
MGLIIYSDSLMKLVKADIKEVTIQNNGIFIPPKVKEETVDIPKKEGFVDAFVIEHNIEKNHLELQKTKRGGRYDKKPPPGPWRGRCLPPLQIRQI